MRKAELEIEEIGVGALVPYEGNAKAHTRAQLDAVKASIEELGFRNPIIVWRGGDGSPVVVAGHARLKAAVELGMETVPCVSCDDLTDAQRRALTLADNQTTMMTGWDEDLLAPELEELSCEFDMSDFGFEADLLGSTEAAGVEEDELPGEAEPRVRRGEVWVLGRHRLMCGDATDPGDLEKLGGGGRSATCSSPTRPTTSPTRGRRRRP